MNDALRFTLGVAVILVVLTMLVSGIVSACIYFGEANCDAKGLKWATETRYVRTNGTCLLHWRDQWVEEGTYKYLVRGDAR